MRSLGDEGGGSDDESRSPKDEVGAFMARLVGISSAVPEAWGSSVRGKEDTP